MQIGIDLGATKIESVLLDENGKEITRGRENSPKNYEDTLNLIRLIVESIEIKQNKKFNVGLCHPGSISKEDDLLFNSNNLSFTLFKGSKESNLHPQFPNCWPGILNLASLPNSKIS